MVIYLPNEISAPAGRDCFPGGENMYLLFNSDILNLLLKTNGGETKKT